MSPEAGPAGQVGSQAVLAPHVPLSLLAHCSCPYTALGGHMALRRGLASSPRITDVMVPLELYRMR